MSAVPDLRCANELGYTLKFGNNVFQAGNRRQGMASRQARNSKNTADVDIFGPIVPFRRKADVACGQIDENRSLPYKPRQLSAMTRSDRGGSPWAAKTARFGPASIIGLISFLGKLPGQRRTTREADLSTQ